MAKRKQDSFEKFIEDEINELKRRLQAKKTKIQKVKIEVWKCNVCHSYLDDSFFCECDHSHYVHSPTEEEYHNDVANGRIQFGDDD